jgi:hypothetical protein
MPVSDTGFWEFESPLGHQFSGCNVSQVDGLLWKQEAAGSKPATQTKQIRTARQQVWPADFQSVERGSIPLRFTHTFCSVEERSSLQVSYAL